MPNICGSESSKTPWCSIARTFLPPKQISTEVVLEISFYWVCRPLSDLLFAKLVQLCGPVGGWLRKFHTGAARQCENPCHVEIFVDAYEMNTLK